MLIFLQNKKKKKIMEYQLVKTEFLNFFILIKIKLLKKNQNS